MAIAGKDGGLWRVPPRPDWDGLAAALEAGGAVLVGPDASEESRRYRRDCAECEFREPASPDHDGPLALVELRCAHGHTERGWGCRSHLALARDRVSRGGSVRCGNCGHVCPVVLRVPATGEVAGPG